MAGVSLTLRIPDNSKKLRIILARSPAKIDVQSARTKFRSCDHQRNIFGIATFPNFLSSASNFDVIGDKDTKIRV